MEGRLDDQIFVRQLGLDTTDDDLMALFEPFGPIKRATIARNKDTGVSRGFGFVAFALAEDAARAVDSLRGRVLKGKSIKIELAAKRGQVIVDKPVAKIGKDAERDEAERARHEARKARALRAKSSKEVEPTEDDDVANPDSTDSNVTTGSMRITHPSGVKPGMVLLLFGVPAALKKRDFSNAIKRICRKTEVELVKEGHYLLDSLNAVYPAGKVFELTAPSRPACAKLIAGLNGVSPHSLGLHPEQETSTESEGSDLVKASIPTAWKDKLYVRTLSQLTQPEFRKRHCRLIVRNLSFQATELNVADKLGRYGPLAEVNLPVITENENSDAKRRRGKEGPKIRTRGFAFVTFLCASDALNAIQACSSTNEKVLKICNREVAVDFCQSKDRFLEGPVPDADETIPEADSADQDNDDDHVDVDKEADSMSETESDGEEQNSNADKKGSQENSDEERDADDDEEEEVPVKSAEAPASTEEASMEDDVSQGRTVFIRGLSLDVHVRDIQKALQPFGKIELSLLVKDKKTGEPRGSAFVKFSTLKEAQACVDASKRGLGIIVADRACVIALAVARDEAERLKSDGRGRIDRRHLYLANEGLALGKADEIAHMPEEEKEKRRMAQAEKKKKLVNPLFAVSALRLSVRNLHKGITDSQLRELCIVATKKGLKRSLANKTDVERLLAADGAQVSPKALLIPEFGVGGKREISSCKVMLDLTRIRGGLPQSRGYGFVEFKNHAHALACLRELNQNTAYSTSAMGVPGSSSKDSASLRSTLIVEFSLENMQKVKILQERVSRRALQNNTGHASSEDTFDSKKRPRSTDEESNDFEAEDDQDEDNAHGQSDSDSDVSVTMQNDDDVSDAEENGDSIPRSASGKSQTPAAKRRRQDQRRREKQGRRLRRKEELTETGQQLPVAPQKTEKKRGGLFSRIREKKKAKSESSA